MAEAIESPRLDLENACNPPKMARLRVHDLRHIFATRCIEAGVDIPAIASWLDHKDGSLLAAKTDRNILGKHSETQIKKVAN